MTIVSTVLDEVISISPSKGEVVARRPLASPEDIESTLEKSARSRKAWASKSLSERKLFCSKAVDFFIDNSPQIGAEISQMMGRPISQCGGEIAGLEERARYMIDHCEEALKTINIEEKEGFNRYIKREPLGTVFVLAPWNFPYLTAINSIIPALLSGNTVILKHAQQTLLCAERFQQAFDAALLPEGVFSHLHLSHQQCADIIGSGQINFVSFTGSVEGGKAIEKAAQGHFIGVGLELGGKDPAYVRHDAQLSHAVETIVDGGMFNSGQSCCGIERVYVHESLYQDFLRQASSLIKSYNLGLAEDSMVNLGPMVNAKAANFVRGQIAEAITQGAVAHIDSTHFACATSDTAFMAPQLLSEVDHSMRVMHEESFGPLLAVQSVANDEEAIRLMNDSEFGLSACVFTQDFDAAIVIGELLETGTFFVNRCDYLDPALAWTGVKNSGRGCSLSVIGFEQLTRPKSFHIRTKF